MSGRLALFPIALLLTILTGCVPPKDSVPMVAMSDRAARAEALVTAANKERCSRELREHGLQTQKLELKADPELSYKAFYQSDRRGEHGNELVIFNTVYENTGIFGKSEVEAGCTFEINPDGLAFVEA